MRDNTPTDRLDQTPSPEQDPSSTPEPDFEFQEGAELIVDAPFTRIPRVRVDRAALYAALPRVARVLPGAQPRHFILELEDGSQVHLSPELVTWAALHPEDHEIGPVIVIRWPDALAEYAAPAALLPELQPYFPAKDNA